MTIDRTFEPLEDLGIVEPIDMITRKKDILKRLISKKKKDINEWEKDIINFQNYVGRLDKALKLLHDATKAGNL